MLKVAKLTETTYGSESPDMKVVGGQKSIGEKCHTFVTSSVLLFLEPEDWPRSTVNLARAPRLGLTCLGTK